MSKRGPFPAENERVPLFGTWRSAYFTIVIAFILQVAIFYAFSRYFS